MTHLELMSTALRILSVDMIEKAKSGHPGMPLGISDVVTVLFSKFIQFNVEYPKWENRDRFVLSAGHASAMLYALYYLLGYRDVTLEDLKKFRQLDSKTAGHPEYGYIDAIETTTGPLGQGVANAVGMAIAQKKLQNHRKAKNYKIYCLCGDGCLMEGISAEASSLAGHLNLDNLVLIFDSNAISIDGPTSLTCSEDYCKTFESRGWHTISIDGHNYEEIEKALAISTKKPLFIECKTRIGKYSNLENSSSCHGAPLGENSFNQLKEKLNWNAEAFEIPENILNMWRNLSLHIENDKDTQNQILSETSFSELDKKEIRQIFDEYYKNPIAEASRQSSGRAIEILTSHFGDKLLGGSADLSGSNNTLAKNHEIFDSTENYKGNYIYYGVREHAMASIMNGIALSGIIPFGGTFLVFSDYARPAIRLAALMKLQVIYIFTHDSVGLGEDGPTHQPVEHLASLRAIPNLYNFRPADCIETAEAWECALNLKSPSVLALSRQKLIPIERQNNAENLTSRGAYIVTENKDIAQGSVDITIFATGSEVGLANEVAHKLREKNKLHIRVVSVPCYELFWEQDLSYQESILNNSTYRIVIEAGISMSWGKILRNHDLFFGIENFGKSGKGGDVMKHFGLDAEHIVNEAINLCDIIGRR